MLQDKVAVVTGAGRGIGREIALLMADRGAKVVVNDLGAELDGEGADASPAAETVAEIKRAGGEAVINGDSVADPQGAAGSLVATALERARLFDVVQAHKTRLERELETARQVQRSLLPTSHSTATFRATRRRCARRAVERSAAGPRSASRPR